MSDCQSMPRRLSGVRYSVKRSSGIGSQYRADMNKSRTEYGARLYAARKHAGLTQTAIAKLVGMSQSGYAEAETTGLTSTYTAQLAAACGVSPQWLATGEGPMASDGKEALPESDQLRAALGVLTKALQKADKDTRIAVEPLLASMAKDPDASGNKSRLILTLLVTEGSSSASDQDSSASHIFGQLGKLDLGEQDGRRDRVAASGGSKK